MSELIDQARAAYEEALTAEWREMPEEARAEIPEHLRTGLDNYILHRLLPGAFLQCVLTNHLEGAVLRANPPEVLMSLPGVFRALNGYAPAISFGSPEKMQAWVKGASV